MTHPVPTMVGKLGPAWITVPSWTDERSPIPMWPKSPRSTAPGHTVASEPIVTSPITTASGWTKASGWISGSRSPSR